MRRDLSRHRKVFRRVTPMVSLRFSSADEWSLQLLWHALEYSSVEIYRAVYIAAKEYRYRTKRFVGRSYPFPLRHCASAMKTLCSKIILQEVCDAETRCRALMICQTKETIV